MLQECVIIFKFCWHYYENIEAALDVEQLLTCASQHFFMCFSIEIVTKALNVQHKLRSHTNGHQRDQIAECVLVHFTWLCFQRQQ